MTVLNQLPKLRLVGTVILPQKISIFLVIIYLPNRNIVLFCFQLGNLEYLLVKIKANLTIVNIVEHLAPQSNI